MREWLWRLRAMFRRDRLAAEKHEELQLHLDLEIEAGVRQGLTAEEARRRARLRAGLVSEGVEETRGELGFRWVDGMVMDLRHAWRALARNRRYGAMAVVVLAASVAINTLIFAMLEGVILRPLPYREPDRLVRVYDEAQDVSRFPVSIGHFLDYREGARSLAGIALYTGHDLELSAAEGRSQRLSSLAVTSDYFSVLGRPPALGRAFVDADLRRGVHHAIISHRLWQDHYGGDPAIVGRVIRLDREPWTIVGVAAAGFQHVGGEYRSPMQGETVDLWIPAPLDGEDGDLRASHYTNCIARIAPGFTRDQVKQELGLMAAAYNARWSQFGEWTPRVEPLLDEVTGRSRQLVWLLCAAGGLVLLLACANIAGLSVARAVSRQRELTLRHALGAGRWQLARVGLSENLLIGLCGAALGLLAAALGLPYLRSVLPADFPRAHEIALTAGGAVFAVSVAIGTALLAGLRSGRGGESLQVHQRVASSRASRRVRTLLVVGEFTLAGLLCAGALFLLRSYQQIGARDHGFKAEGVLTFQVSVPFDDEDRRARVIEEVRERLAAVPGVAAAGATTNLPWSGYDENATMRIVGRPDETARIGARFQAASPGYFQAAGMRLIAGRLFDPIRDARAAPLTIIVNDALAERDFPDGGAVGTVVKTWGQERTIVGVVGGIKDTPADLDTKPGWWFPMPQKPFGQIFFAVRSSGPDPASLTASVVAAVHAVDSELAVADVRTLERRAAGALAARRFAMSLFEAFAALALVLAAAGIYGLLAFVVQQRRKELVIRVALGARRSTLARMIVGDGLKMAAAGAVCSLILIPIGGVLLQSFLYNVKAFDLVTIAGAPFVLVCAAILASVGPARSATRSDPAHALRED